MVFGRMKDWMPRSGDQTRKMHAPQTTEDQKLCKISIENFFGSMVFVIMLLRFGYPQIIEKLCGPLAERSQTLSTPSPVVPTLPCKRSRIEQ